MFPAGPARAQAVPWNSGFWFGSAQRLTHYCCLPGPGWAWGMDEPAQSLSLAKLALTES